jgi:predicted alpha/beta hydrolase
MLAPSASGREVHIPAEDGRLLAATLFEPQPGAGEPIPTVIAGGTGIARRYYGRFGAYLAERGRLTLTFDYRDIGGSRSGSLESSKVRMRDWCTLDLAGVLAWVARECPGRPIHFVGHSLGGFGAGLAHNNRLIARQLNIAALSGYWRNMASPERYRVRLLMGGLGRPVVAALGYFPGRLIGGEDMPGPAFLEWRRWCMTPDFLFGDPTLEGKANFASLAAPIRFACIEDDVWGTPAAVEAIAARFTGAADKSMWHIRLTEAGATRIGHHGFFRAEFRDTLWAPAVDWLERGSDPAPRRRPGLTP